MNVNKPFSGAHHILESRLQSLEEEFQQANQDLNLDALEARLQKLRDIVSCPRCHKAYTNNWNDRREELLRVLQGRAVESFGALEKAVSEKLSYDHGEIARYLADVSRTTIRHGEVADFSHRSRVLFIGCGALPLSCHILVRHFGCEVVGLDVDGEAIERAKILSRGKCSNRLTLVQGSGTEVLANGFTHVVVASLVPGKEEIIDHLYGSIDRGSKVVCRFGNGLQRLLNYPLRVGPRKHWERLWILGDMASLYQTLVLAKR